MTPDELIRLAERFEAWEVSIITSQGDVWLTREARAAAGAALRAYAHPVEFAHSGSGEVARTILASELAQQRKDTERYRWIRETQAAGDVEHALHTKSGAEFDAEIDRLMKLLP